MSERVVMYDSAAAATYRTDIKGWVSRDGLYFGENEHSARWSGCTHQKCACGNIHEKGRTICNSCYAKQWSDKYYALPMVKWDGDTPLYSWDDDQFFFDESDLLDWMAGLKEDAGNGDKPEVQLVLCDPGKLHLIDHDTWCDDLPEDGELPDEVATKIDELNEVLRNAPTLCWYPGKTRIDVDELWRQLETEEKSQ
jgi:hypothetical protein